MKFKLFYLPLLLTSLFADVTSKTGSIKFDANNDTTEEMTLNSFGLGLGKIPTEKLDVNGNAIIGSKLFIGADTGSANLNISGTVAHGFQSVSSNTVLSESSLVLANSSAANLFLTLPSASLNGGLSFKVKKTSRDNEVILQTESGEGIEGNHHIRLASGEMGSVTLISDAQHWQVLSLSGNGDQYQVITTVDGSSGVSGFVRYNMATSMGGQVTVKNAGATNTYTRKGYVRIDLSSAITPVNSATFQVKLELTNAVNHVYYVYGLLDESLDNWDSSTITYNTAPANDLTSGYAADTASGNAMFLGQFSVGSADAVGDVKSITGTSLTTFINSDTNGKVTFMIGRLSGVSNENVGFGSEANDSPPRLILVTP